MTISLKSSDAPDTINIADDEVRDQLNVQTTQISSFVQSLYALSLWDTQKGALYDNTTTLSVGNSSSSRDNVTPEFVFRTPPRNVEMSEPYATNIIPTQNGGKYVESHGSILKDIRITGTTGLRPAKSDPRVLNLFGLKIGKSASILGAGTVSNALGTTPTEGVREVNPFTDDFQNGTFAKARSLPAEEITGHDDVTFLKNLFRLYSDIKASAELASRVVMLWRDVSSGEYWVVEPREFKLTKDAKSPLTYEYNIMLTTLAPFNFQYYLPEDPQAKLKNARRAISRVKEYTQQLSNTFLLISSKIDLYGQLPYNVTETILGPLVATIQGLTAVTNSSFAAAANVKSYATTLKDNIRTVLDDLENALSGEETRQERRDLIRAYYTVCNILTDDSLSTTTTERKIKDIKDSLERAYNTQGSQTTVTKSPNTAGSKSFLGNQPNPRSYAQTRVGVGESLRDIASRTIGDSSQWHILAVINELQAPYISGVSSQGVLAAGDTIMYPSSDKKVNTGVGTYNIDNAESDGVNAANQGPIQDTYGRDLRLVSTAGGSSANLLVDFAINQRGDISTVNGTPNVSQAVKIKFATRRGELPAHPFFGAKFPIGSKATPTNIAGFRVEAQATILSDLRIKKINSMQINTYADVLVISATLQLIDSNDSIKTTLPVRSL